MSVIKDILKAGISIPVNFDRMVAWITKNKPWGEYKKGNTISWGFGEEEAEILYAMWVHDRKICNNLPYISLKDHPLGQFSEDICTAIQSVASGRKRFHGLECWLNDPSALEKKYPGITEVVKTYLRSQGVKV
jgi:hypothetical protein